jgi:hypothetical protein
MGTKTLVVVFCQRLASMDAGRQQRERAMWPSSMIVHGVLEEKTAQGLFWSNNEKIVGFQISARTGAQTNDISGTDSMPAHKAPSRPEIKSENDERLADYC